MTHAYLIPDTPLGNTVAGAQGVKTIPINRMRPRSFYTNLADSTSIKAGASHRVRGIAFGGDCEVARVLFPGDSGSHGQDAQLGPGMLGDSCATQLNQ